jgi:hypothetical protein
LSVQAVVQAALFRAVAVLEAILLLTELLLYRLAGVGEITLVAVVAVVAEA